MKVHLCKIHGQIRPCFYCSMFATMALLGLFVTLLSAALVLRALGQAFLWHLHVH